jgi:hypothetical protein
MFILNASPLCCMHVLPGGEQGHHTLLLETQDKVGSRLQGHS